MADIPVQDTQDGGTPTFQPASAEGDSFVNDGQVVIVAGGPSAEFALVFANGRECEFGEHPALQQVCELGNTSITTPRFDTYRFNDRSGRVQLTYSPNAVGIQVAALRYHLHLKDEEAS